MCTCIPETCFLKHWYRTPIVLKHGIRPPLFQKHEAFYSMGLEPLFLKQPLY